MKRLLAALALVAFLVSGCLDGTEVQTPVGTVPLKQMPTFVNPAILGHDHKDLSLHEIANDVELVGHDYLGGPKGGFGEMDVQGDYAYIAAFDAGFTIVDLKDPSAPRLVSQTHVDAPPSPLYGIYTADLKVDKTGNWVFVALEVSATPGVMIFDATNKQAPKLAGFWPSPGKLLGCHMIEYAEIGGQEYVMCAPLDAAIYIGLLSPAAGGTRQIATVARWAPMASQKYATDLVADAGRELRETALSFHDDMTFQPDPLTKKPTMFVSLWGLGVWVVDLSVPAAPLTLGNWIGEGAKLFRGNIHTAMAFESDKKRIVVAIPEVANPPAMFVIDMTDLAKPKLLSEWTALPSFKNEAGADEAGTFSMHNFQIVDGKVYIAMYHGAEWVIDLSTPELQKTPMPIASYLPHMPRPDGKGYETGQWDIIVWHGYILTGDNNAGFYVLHRDGDPAGDPAYTSFA